MKSSDILTHRRGAPAILVAVLALLALDTAPVLAQGPNHPGAGQYRQAMLADDQDDSGYGPGGGRFLERLARRLELSDTQREAIDRIFQTGRERDVPVRKQMQQLRHELEGEMMKDEPASKNVAGLARQLGELRTQLQIARLEDRLAMRKVLTPAQRDQLLLMGAGGRGGHPGRGPRWHQPRPDAD